MARLVVFRDTSELIELRDLLYGDLAEQKRGLTKAKAYQVRGNLPPSVHVTCLVVAAIHSDTPANDFFAIRQIYAMALVRFVNEILDGYQVGKSVVPLHILACEIGIPSSFVELRHAATHEELPSVNLLRSMAKRALQWLHDNFWSKQKAIVDQEVVPDNGSGSGYGESPGDRIKELLKEWRRLKRSDSAAQPSHRLVSELRSEWIANRSEFLVVCLNRNILVPAGTSTIPKKGVQVVELWLPLFSALGASFCEELLYTVVSALLPRDWPTLKTENRKYAVLETWAEKLAPFATNKTLNQLKQSPRPWNARILAIYACANADIDTYSVAQNMSVFTGAIIPEFRDESSSIEGWKKVPGWTARPLGCP